MAVAALATAIVGVLWPAVVAWPAAALAAWIGLSWLGKAWTLRHDHAGPDSASATPNGGAEHDVGGPPPIPNAARAPAESSSGSGGGKTSRRSL
jgi:hypothetical protein